MAPNLWYRIIVTKSTINQTTVYPIKNYGIKQLVLVANVTKWVQYCKQIQT